jgi:hypothetical protein
MSRFAAKLAQLLLLLIVPLTIGFSGPVAAVSVFQACSGVASKTDVCNTNSLNPSHSNQNPIISFIRTAITVLAVVIGIAAVIMLVISGLRIITANGDSQAVASARTGIINALVGLLVAALAESLVTFVLNKL